MTVSTTSSLNGLFNTIYEDALFVAREQNLMAGLVTNFTGEGMAHRKQGTRPSLTAQEVAEGSDYSNATEWTKVAGMDLTPKIVQVQTILLDTEVATDPEDARASAAMEMGGAIGTKIDTDLVGLFSSFTTGKGSANAALTIAICGAAIAVLTKNHAPNPIVGVLHPYGWHDIWTLLGQPAANQAFLGETANEAMKSYFAGNFLRAQWFTDANISIDSSDDAIGAFFHRDALALDTRRAPTLEPERDASLSGGAWELNMSVWYGVAVRRDTFGVKVTHDATEPT